MNTANDIDWRKVKINRLDLINWIVSKGINPPFFADEISRVKTSNNLGSVKLSLPAQKPKKPAYLDPENPRYAPKLAAAIRAWEAVGDPQGKTPKQAMEAWLKSNAQELDLLNTDGTAAQTAIEEIAKVANWKPGGGVPATPGK